MNLECRDTKLLACFWVCLATLKGRANRERPTKHGKSSDKQEQQRQFYSGECIAGIGNKHASLPDSSIAHRYTLDEAGSAHGFAASFRTSSPAAAATTTTTAAAVVVAAAASFTHSLHPHHHHCPYSLYLCKCVSLREGRKEKNTPDPALVKQLATDSNKGESRQSVSHCQTWQEGGHTHTHTHTPGGRGGVADTNRQRVSNQKTHKKQKQQRCSTVATTRTYLQTRIFL